MKNFNLLFACILFAVFYLGACKNSESSIDHSSVTVSFEYQGKTYQLGDSAWGLMFTDYSVSGIYINMYPQIKWMLSFESPDCAFFNAGTKGVAKNGRCIITNSDGTPIDSATVYLYQTGSIKATSSDITSDIDTASLKSLSIRILNVTGTFSLTVINNKGDKIEIKNGSFSGRWQADSSVSFGLPVHFSKR